MVARFKNPGITGAVLSCLSVVCLLTPAGCSKKSSEPAAEEGEGEAPAPTVQSGYQPTSQTGGGGGRSSPAVLAPLTVPDKPAAAPAKTWESVVSKDGSDQLSDALQDIVGGDKVAPEAPTLISPLLTTVVSGEPGLAITAGCENGATVRLADDFGATDVSCADAAASFTYLAADSGTFALRLSQSDAAGNTSAETLLTFK